MVGWAHLKDEVKRPSPKPEEKDAHHAQGEGDHQDGEAAGASGGRKRGYRHGDVNKGGAKFVVGLGADDIDESMRGEGTKHLLELLWSMRSDEFEKNALLSDKQR